jgi:hypothetical protein
VGVDVLITEIDLAIDIGRHFENLRVRWHVGGSVASSILGVPRTTVDIDLVADLRQHHVKPLVAALLPTYYVDEDTVQWAVSTRRSFNAIHEASAIKVDVFCARDDDLGREELDRQLVLELRGHPVPIASAEDIILEKLSWYRQAGGSERQWGDAKGVVDVRGDTLDLTYLRRHAAQLGLTSLLEALVTGALPPPV